jgi:hypothetical protein
MVEERKERNLDRRHMRDRKEGRGILDGINGMTKFPKGNFGQD